MSPLLDRDSTGSQQGNGEEWVRVTRKSRSKQHTCPSRRIQKANPAVITPRIESLQLSVDDIASRHDQITSRWHSTSCHRQLCDIIAAEASDRQRITRAVCMGIGSFDPDNGSWDAKRRTHVQLAAFLAIVRCLEDAFDTNITCLFQEPLFTQSEKDFISGLGHTIVDSPKAFEIIDQTTMLFAVHLYRDVYAAALAKDLPGIFVGTGWNVWDEYMTERDVEQLQRMKEMHETHDRFPFPQDGTAFSSTSLYWMQKPKAMPDEPPR